MLGSSFGLRVHPKAWQKAVLSQRWPRNAPHIWVPWKFSGLPDYAHFGFSPNFSWAFVLTDLVNVLTKFKLLSFTRSWDNRGYPNNLGSPWICPPSLFSNNFNGTFSRSLAMPTLSRPIPQRKILNAYTVQTMYVYSFSRDFLLQFWLRIANSQSWRRGGRRGSGVVPFERALVSSYTPSNS